jgi:hypothetical protein
MLHPPNGPWLHHLNNVWWRVHIVKILTVQFFTSALFVQSIHLYIRLLYDSVTLESKAVTTGTTYFNIQQLLILPSECTYYGFHMAVTTNSDISFNSVNQFIYIMVKCCVFFEVWTQFLILFAWAQALKCRGYTASGITLEERTNALEGPNRSATAVALQLTQQTICTDGECDLNPSLRQSQRRNTGSYALVQPPLCITYSNIRSLRHFNWNLNIELANIMQWRKKWCFEFYIFCSRSTVRHVACAWLPCSSSWDMCSCSHCFVALVSSKVYANKVTQWQGILLVFRRYGVWISARTVPTTLTDNFSLSKKIPRYVRHFQQLPFILIVAYWTSHLRGCNPSSLSGRYRVRISARTELY